MEEGPEPQEWVERAAEEHHHAHEEESSKKRPEMMASAITAAILAVMAAIGSLLSGHAANHAILGQMQATDKWSQYQSVSTKGHLFEVNAELVEALAGPDKGVDSKSRSTGLLAKAKEYETKKEEIKKEAEDLVRESTIELTKHNRFSLGIAAFQVGIVLSSVSILVRLRLLYYLSLASGVVGIGFLLYGSAS